MLVRSALRFFCFNYPASIFIGCNAFETRTIFIAFEAVNNAKYVQMEEKIYGIFSLRNYNSLCKNFKCGNRFLLMRDPFAFLICNSARRLISSEIFITVTCWIVQQEERTDPVVVVMVVGWMDGDGEKERRISRPTLEEMEKTIQLVCVLW